MKDNPNSTLEQVIQQDPTLKAILRDNRLDSKNFDWQVKLSGAAILIAIRKDLDNRYPTRTK